MRLRAAIIGIRSLTKALRTALALGAVTLALPISCSQGGSADGVYTGGIQPSPAGRVNPTDPRFANGGR